MHSASLFQHCLCDTLGWWLSCFPLQELWLCLWLWLVGAIVVLLSAVFVTSWQVSLLKQKPWRDLECANLAVLSITWEDEDKNLKQTQQDGCCTAVHLHQFSILVHIFFTLLEVILNMNQLAKIKLLLLAVCIFVVQAIGVSRSVYTCHVSCASVCFVHFA